MSSFRHFWNRCSSQMNKFSVNSKERFYGIRERLMRAVSNYQTKKAEETVKAFESNSSGDFKDFSNYLDALVKLDRVSDSEIVKQMYQVSLTRDSRLRRNAMFGSKNFPIYHVVNLHEKGK